MKLAIADSAWWPVVIDVPADGGKVQSLEVEGQFSLHTDEEYAELMKLPQGELLGRVLKDWRGIEDEAGQPLPFTPAARSKMVKIRWALRGFVDAFVKIHNGAGLKN